jgi:hypothetical protein
MKSSLLSAVLALAPGAIAWKEVSNRDSLNYTSVPGFFLQDDPNTNPSTFDYVRKDYSSYCEARQNSHMS